MLNFLASDFAWLDFFSILSWNPRVAEKKIWFHQDMSSSTLMMLSCGSLVAVSLQNQRVFWSVKAWMLGFIEILCFSFEISDSFLQWRFELSVTALRAFCELDASR